MKIGILTYHRSHNYGAMLQAVALRKVLHDMGHDVYFIDYWPQHQRNIYTLFMWKDFWRGGLRGRVRYLRNFFRELIPKLLRRRNFNRFYREQIRPYVKSQKAEYDVIVYGSDQIWRKQKWGYGYNPVYFGKNDFKAKKHISYAASMGTLPTEPEDVETILEYVRSLDKVSVRETDLKEFMTDKGFSKIQQTLDPTLLLSEKEWKNLMKNYPIISQPYLLFYDLQCGAFDSKEVEIFSNRLNLKVIKISGGATHLPQTINRTTDGPYEFLKLLYHASYVITSSFHGLVFALIFHKPFTASLTANKSRIKSLLLSVGLSDRFLTDGQSLLEANAKEIKWKDVQVEIDKLNVQSLDFLRNALLKSSER